MHTNSIIRILQYGWPSFVVSLVIFYLSCLTTFDDIPEIDSIAHLDKIAHFGMYFALSIASSSYYIHRNKGEIKLNKFIIFAIVAPILYGGLIELLQDQYFHRTGDWLDLVANISGVLATLPFAFYFRKFIIKHYSN